MNLCKELFFLNGELFLKSVIFDDDFFLRFKICSPDDECLFHPYIYG